MAVVFSDFIDFPDGSKHQMQADKVIALIFAICDALGARKNIKSTYLSNKMEIL